MTGRADGVWLAQLFVPGGRETRPEVVAAASNRDARTSPENAELTLISRHSPSQPQSDSL